MMESLPKKVSESMFECGEGAQGCGWRLQEARSRSSRRVAETGCWCRQGLVLEWIAAVSSPGVSTHYWFSVYLDI